MRSLMKEQILLVLLAWAVLLAGESTDRQILLSILDAVSLLIPLRPHLLPLPFLHLFKE